MSDHLTMSGPGTTRAYLPWIGLVLAGLLLIGAGPAAVRGRVAIVVHKSNALDDLSSAELRRILLGDETRWPGKEKITILLLPPGSEERKTLLRVLLRMSDDDFIRHWISRVFQGEATAGPKTASSAASLLRLVAGLPSALGVLDAEDVQDGDAGLKVLRIDGKAPSEDGYPLVR